MKPVASVLQTEKMVFARDVDLNLQYVAFRFRPPEGCAC